jgi:hypothetical protein
MNSATSTSPGWTFGVGSGAHILVGALLDSARRATEGDDNE